MSILSALKTCHFLMEMPEQELLSIAGCSRVVRQPRGTVVFDEGDDCRGMYIVSSGAVKLYKTAPDGKEHVLFVAMPGDCFGEAALFLGGGYPASAQAMKDSELILIRKDPFLELLEKKPKMCFQLMGSMARWAHRLVTKIEILTSKDAAGRLAGHLYSTARKAGLKGPGEIDLGVPKQILASQLGITSETFSRLLTRFEAQELILCQGRRVEILDLRGLKELSEMPPG